MAGEFGRTPRISTLPAAYKLPGPRPLGPGPVGLLRRAAAWSAAGSIGSSDRIGGHPASDPQTPENLAATIYRALGIPAVAAWHDDLDRPHSVYHGDPIAGLS